MSRWRIRRGHAGWFIYEWTHPNGRKIASYPIPSYWWAIPLYPWFVFTSIKAIRQLRTLCDE